MPLDSFGKLFFSGGTRHTFLTSCTRTLTFESFKEAWLAPMLLLLIPCQPHWLPERTVTSQTMLKLPCSWERKEKVRSSSITKEWFLPMSTSTMGNGHSPVARKHKQILSNSTILLRIQVRKEHELKTFLVCSVLISVQTRSLLKDSAI